MDFLRVNKSKIQGAKRICKSGMLCDSNSIGAFASNCPKAGLKNQSIFRVTGSMVAGKKQLRLSFS